MLSKSLCLTLACSALSGSLAHAAPFGKRAGIGTSADAPWYCKPASMLKEYDTYQWLDISQDCQFNANCDNACLAIHTSSMNADLVSSDLDDLKNAVGQQSLKDSRFKWSYKGIWMAGYTDWLGHDLFPSEMLQYYFHQIAALESVLEEASVIDDITFSWHQGGKSNVMVASRTDYFKN